ncbi:MAG: cytochrome P450, partial [Polyangiaceae bacterium]|nr:cytochrome P450 [Polyangiaceae bacterium]
RYATVDRFFGLAVAGVPAALLPGFRAARARLAADAAALRPGHAVLFDRRREFFAERALPESQFSRFDASILWASQANTVAAAFWTLRYLLGDPRAKAAVTEEVRTLSPAPSAAGDAEPLGRDALRRMVLLDSACSEAMRLTSAPMVLRRASAAFELPLDRGDTLRVKAGDELMLYPRHTHFDPELFPEPERFRFDRFVDERGRPTRFDKGGRRVTMPFLPFGGGVSMCPGRFFARNEIKILVATLLGLLDTELASSAMPALDFARVGLGVLPPLGDVTIRMRRRA